MTSAVQDDKPDASGPEALNLPQHPNAGAPSGESELRRHVDSGRTYDKVKGQDPATVPLGIDAEAAGTPTSSQAIEAAIDLETMRPTEPDEDVVERTQKRDPFAWLLLGAFAAAFAGLTAMVWSMS